MSGLAQLLLKEGHLVFGVDVEEEFYTSKNLKGIILEDFSKMNLKPTYFYIIGNAFKNHSVANYIKNMRYRYMDYPSFLVQHFKSKKWICISGSHGKTTTTKMIAHMMKNVTSLIGDGEVVYGDSPYFLIEACEYRNTFLNYHPFCSLILNVDYDHPDFFKSKEAYEKSFSNFIEQSTYCIINGDEYVSNKEYTITFGRSKNNDVIFDYYRQEDKGIVSVLGQKFVLPFLGQHYAYDFVGAYLVCKFLGKKDYEIQDLIQGFKMPKRRLETIIIDEQVIICDYAHHPTEIKAFYEGINEKYPEYKKIAIFQPHTISRLDAFYELFKKSLDCFDECYLTPIFTSCREAHDRMKEQRLYLYLNYQKYTSVVEQIILKKENVVICFLGAGNIDEQFKNYIAKIESLKNLLTN